VEERAVLLAQMAAAIANGEQTAALSLAKRAEACGGSRAELSAVELTTSWPMRLTKSIEQERQSRQKEVNQLNE